MNECNIVTSLLLSSLEWGASRQSSLCTTNIDYLLLLLLHSSSASECVFERSSRMLSSWEIFRAITNPPFLSKYRFKWTKGSKRGEKFWNKFASSWHRCRNELFYSICSSLDACFFRKYTLPDDDAEIIIVRMFRESFSGGEWGTHHH